MSPDEQAERDQLAMALDTLLALVTHELEREHVDRPPSESLSQRLAQRPIDPGWLEVSRKRAVA